MHGLRGFARDVAGGRLLLAYIGVTFVVGVALEIRPLWTQITNTFVLLPLYLGIIYAWTRNDTPLSATEIGRPARWREIVVLVAPWAIVIGVTAWALAVRTPPAVLAAPSAGAAPSANASASVEPYRALFSLRLGNAAMSTLKQTLPALALCWIARMSWRRIGFAPRHLGLAGVLIAIGVVNFAVVSAMFGVPLARLPLFAFPALVVPYYLVQIFINALPEELGSRGLVLQRWLALTGSKDAAIVISTVFFTMIHAPFLLLHDSSLTLIDVAERLSFGAQPTGIVWAYSFYRTRSLWPGILWHASYEVLGILFV